MSDTAIGLIETHGLIGVLAAADTAAKAADVQLLGVERVGGGLVSVRFRGDTASVQAAVSAASEAVRQVSQLVSAHVIPSPAIDVEAALAT
ncbi:MAG TPA: ethanolamine utilization protein EutM, partial [Candidatus Latescibacteria bacterium]|nr:ethanolamine utilization protein EutM [Candidatus Latescibacterota bacterium]